MLVTKGRQQRPALVIVHGGGWNAGAKTDPVYPKIMVDYALKGYVTLNVNYRLTGEAPFPACIKDVLVLFSYLFWSASKTNSFESLDNLRGSR